MQTNARLVSDYPEGVVFEQRDGIYWLGRKDLRLVEAVTGVSYDSDCVGFDREGAIAEALFFLRRGLNVGLRRGNAIRMLTMPIPARPNRRATSTFFLAPELLIDPRDLQTLQNSLARPGCKLKASYERWLSALACGDEPAISVYQVSKDLYEVDWHATELSEASLAAVALAATELKRKLRCVLVSPRRSRPQTERPALPHIYGQLQLQL